MVLASNFLVPNATFVVELVAFIGVLFALRRGVLPVINKSMEDRQATIRQALVDAEEAKRRAAEAEEENRFRPDLNPFDRGPEFTETR